MATEAITVCFSTSSIRNSNVYSYNGLGGANQVEMPNAAKPSKPGVDGHAGEVEVSQVMASRPDLGHPDRAGRESGETLRRLDLPAGVSTAINWYSMYPNHYQGDASGATAARGTALLDYNSTRPADAIRAIKADQTSLRLQKEFFEKSKRPLDTRQ